LPGSEEAECFLVEENGIKELIIAVIDDADITFIVSEHGFDCRGLMDSDLKIQKGKLL
jgi:hypothetical protein